MGWGWIYLVIAGLTEMGFNYFLELSKEFKPALVGFLICYVLSGIFIYQAVYVQSLPIGNAYVLLTAFSSLFIVLISMFFFEQRLNSAQLFFLIAIVVSVVGLKVMSKQVF